MRPETKHSTTKIAITGPEKNKNLNYGLGIDCSASLLYERATSFVRKLILMFSDRKTNPHGSKLILLTKGTNEHYLKDLSTENVIVTFRLNPQPIADLWEGIWPDGVRITPDIEKRLDASLLAQEYGFEVRWRIDPIFPVEGWQDIYGTFIRKTAGGEHRPTRITLGTYREMGRTLLTFSRGWGLAPMGWEPKGMAKEGSHLDRAFTVPSFV